MMFDLIGHYIYSWVIIWRWRWSFENDERWNLSYTFQASQMHIISFLFCTPSENLLVTSTTFYPLIIPWKITINRNMIWVWKWIISNCRNCYNINNFWYLPPTYTCNDTLNSLLPSLRKFSWCSINSDIK